MSTAKITVSIDEELLSRLDLMVAARVFASRSQAVQAALKDKVARTRLINECAKLDVAEEQCLAEEGIALEADLWPPY